MDAAYDAVSGVRPDSPRATLTKKPRGPRKPRAEKEAAPEVTPAGTDISFDDAPLPPQPEPASAASTKMKPQEEAKEAAQEGEDKSGSKVVSLDSFRKK
jgi:hypothetical protein